MRTIELSAPLSGRTEPELPPGDDGKKRYSIFYIGLWSVIAYFFITRFILMSVVIQGVSMSPTLLDGEKYVLFRCQYFWRPPHRGEIVVIRDPEDHNLSIKRIIAVPHDRLEIKADGVYLNGQKLLEPYLTAESVFAAGQRPVKPITLGDKDYFVLGDNREVSADSRTYGPVPGNFILGLISK